jgi:hypothetical protein
MPLTAGEAPDLKPAERQEPLPPIQAAAEEGPVMVQIDYEVGPSDAPAFVAAMDEVGHLRRRNGAIRWRLFQDVSDGGRWTEIYVLGDWVEHRRLRRRMTRADAALEARAVSFHRGREAPVRRYLVARRHDSRFLLDEAEQAEVAASKETAAATLTAPGPA